MHKYLIFLAVTACFSCRPAAKWPLPLSGYYSNDLILASDPQSAEISGVIGLESEDCQIYFAGKYTQDKINIVSWELGKKKEEKVFGVLERTGLEDFRLYLVGNYPDCKNLEAFNDPGTATKLIREKPWTRIWTVKSTTANFHSRPDTASSMLGNIPKGTVLKVISKNTFWAEAESIETDSASTPGWIQIKELMRFPG